MDRPESVTKRPFRKWLIPFLWPGVSLAWLLLGPVRAYGKRRIPRSGGVLILSNHLSDVDPILLQTIVFRHVDFMAKSELWEMPSVGWFLNLWRAFPVRRGEPDRAALKRSVELLKAGHAVGVFPEGELSESGELLPLKTGVALIARQAGVPVICVGLSGTNRMLPYGKRIPRPAFSTVKVRFGVPWTPDPKIGAEEFMAKVRHELLELTRP